MSARPYYAHQSCPERRHFNGMQSWAAHVRLRAKGDTRRVLSADEMRAMSDDELLSIAG